MTEASARLSAGQRAEKRVLAELRRHLDSDGRYLSFATLQRATELDRKAVRRACRSLARKGLAVYARGLWTEDGEVAGAGYAATPEPPSC